MRNLIHERDLEGIAPTVPIQRKARPLTERDFTRHIREAGRKQRVLEVRVRRAMKRSGDHG